MSTTLAERTQDLSLAEADLAKLKAFGQTRQIAKGETLWGEGALPDTLWHVQSGKVNMVITSSDGKDSIVHYCTKAQTLCVAAAISGKAMPCSAVAATDLTMVAIPRRRFLDLFKALPSFARGIMEQMAGQVCESHRVSAMTATTVRERLADLLGRLHRDFAGRSLPFTRQELANMTGTTVESAIRTLSEWEKDGVIETHRGTITVRQPAALEALAA
jgi:CRP-like cAMP-binding protein